MESTQKKIAIIGAGSFGTALSIILSSRGHEVMIWAREPEIAESIARDHRNPAYLNTVRLPESVRATTVLAQALRDSDVVLFATPSHTLREMARRCRQWMTGRELVVSVAKGLEKHTFMRMSQVLAESFEGVLDPSRVAVLSGPSHAEEVALNKPTTVVSASMSEQVALEVQEIFLTPMFRVYVNHDLVGVEIAAAVKNIMAIAAGIVEGAGLGDNAIAALITRGLHEMKRMGLEMGARPETFSGLAGMGDLIVTCTSRHSRNRNLGIRIAKGQSLTAIVKSMNMVAEGIKTAESVMEWAELNGVDMPITAAVHGILFGGLDPSEAVHSLMTREPKEEVAI